MPSLFDAAPRTSTRGAGRVGNVGPGVIGVGTHSDLVVGAGGTVAGVTTIGTIILPAGGPWIIYGVFGQVVQQTATPGESFGGSVELIAIGGDIRPNPSPSRFPIGMGGSFLGATNAQRCTPLALWPVNYEAPGKASIQMNYREESAVTVASLVICGLLYGLAIPETKRITYIDRVRVATNAAAETAVGDFTLSESASRITHVGGIIVQDNVLVTAEELLGFFRLSSDSAIIQPANYPCGQAFGAGLGAVIEQPFAFVPRMIPVDIPVPGGSIIEAFIDLSTAVTNNAEVEIFLAYE